jgi:carbon storage regulator
MLVLCRKIGEKIKVGPSGSIVITLIEIRGNRARIGIEAPAEIRVDRAEVFDLRQPPPGDPRMSYEY